MAEVLIIDFMKNSISKILSSALALFVFGGVLASPPAVGASSIKVGQKCPLVGFTQSDAGKEFICKKIGKKLKWQKNKSISSPNPVPSLVFDPISLDNLDLRQIPKIAYQNVIKVLDSRSRVAFQPTVIASSNVSKSRADQELIGISRAIDFFSPFYLPEKFQVVYMTGNDVDWMNKKSDELGLAVLLPPGDTWEIQLKRYSPCGAGSAGKANGIPTFVLCLERPYSGAFRANGPHEYTHLFQQLDREKQHPWYIEGSAMYFGWTLAFHPYDPLSRERSDLVKGLFNNFGEVSVSAQNDFASKDMTKFKERMNSLSNTRNTRETAGVSYWVGSLATEVLIALYGMDKFFTFAKQMRDGQDLESSMKETFGITPDTFYEKLAPYAWAQMN